MNSNPDNSFNSLTFNLPANNIDTDQIYPARYLTTTNRQGLGQYCFLDWRQNPASEHFRLFKHLDTQRQRILVAGDNFGCGSSREHAVWSLLDFGFKAVISTRFGDIFYANALNNGLLLIPVDQETHEFLFQHDQQLLHIDIETREIDIPGLGRKEFSLDQFFSYCLINDTNALGYLLQHRDEISTYESGNPA